MKLIAGALYLRGLSKREVEVCEELVDLPSNEVLAARLEVTTFAVKFHLNQIFRKLGVRSRTMLFGTLEAMIKEHLTAHHRLPGEVALYKGAANGKA